MQEQRAFSYDHCFGAACCEQEGCFAIFGGDVNRLQSKHTYGFAAAAAAAAPISFSCTCPQCHTPRCKRCRCPQTPSLVHPVVCGDRGIMGKEEGKGGAG
eukprot:1157839-Pelagomonas_calceolata.AAC.4